MFNNISPILICCPRHKKGGRDQLQLDVTLITSASQPCLPLKTQEEIVDFCPNWIVKGQLMPLLQSNLTTTAASLVTRPKKHEHVIPVLHNWHWLPVHKRTSFKMLLMTFKVLNGKSCLYYLN